MINNSGFKLTSGMIEIIKEGISSYCEQIENNQDKISKALLEKDSELSVGQIEELVLINQALQKQINEAEEILNKPTPRGI
ncbi:MULTISPECIES: hypothetical protein [Vagococcus]|uniref:hypothetical protein n=1 Tax=Vagococcus TaxID=2737 RepID=UPI00288EBD20|nr:hypothetical protein [Vagococcus carniphilus]MDT2813751.1 hypothetical protein [Vagococcus carniphilus]